MIGCRGNIKSEFKKKVCFSRKSRLKVTYMFMALTNSLAVLLIAVLLQIFLTKLLQQCFLFFIVVVILGHNLGNSQVSVYRTIGPTLGLQIGHPLMRPI